MPEIAQGFLDARARLSRAVKKILVEERRFSAAPDPTRHLGFQPLLGKCLKSSKPIYETRSSW